MEEVFSLRSQIKQEKRVQQQLQQYSSRQRYIHLKQDKENAKLRPNFIINKNGHGQSLLILSTHCFAELYSKKLTQLFLKLGKNKTRKPRITMKNAFCQMNNVEAGCLFVKAVD